MNQPCGAHSGHDARLTAAESAIVSLWKAVNSIKGWVMAGMGSMLVYFLTVAADKIFRAQP